MKHGTRSQVGAPMRLLLFRLLHPERARLGAALVITLAAAVADLLPYILISRSIGLTFAHDTSGTGLLSVAGLIGGVLLAKYLLYSLAYYFSHVAAYRLLTDIRQALIRRLGDAPLIWLQQHSSGHLKKAVLQDVERLEQFIAHHTVECLAATASPIFVVLVLTWIDWRLAAAALLTVPLAAAAQALLMRGLGPRIDRYTRNVGDLNGATVEYIRNAPVMKAFCQNSRSFQRMRTLLDRYHDLITIMTKRTVPGWSAFVVLLGANIAFLLPTALWLHRQGNIVLGDVILALMLGTGMLKPLFKVAHFSSEIREIGVGLRRLAPILDCEAPQPPSGTPAASQNAGAITFDRISFTYGDHPVLEDVSFSLPAGTFTALVGPSGAGKSTIAHLISGLVNPDDGEIRIGSVPLSSFSERERSRLIAMASQETFLFRGTLMENLRLGRPEAGEDLVSRAARIAQADTFISALPDGYQTLVGERGARLSGGERQRITIARALLCETPILVLDEATAFADSRTERRFYQALRQAYPDKTLLVIAHRLTTIEKADQVIVLEKGRITDCGRHSELIARCSLYRRLWQRQFDSEHWSIRPEVNADATLS